MRAAGIGMLAPLLLAALSGCAGSPTTFTPSARFAQSATGAISVRDLVRVWGRNFMRVPLPGAGCFRASYPAVAWSRVACVPAPHVWFPHRAAGRIDPAVIGNGADYAIKVLPLSMMAAIGWFPAVDGIRKVTSCAPHFANGNSCGTHGLGNNVYSLQLNSNNFSTAACGKQKHCLGWEQFVYTNQPKYYNGGNLIIQDWLISSTTRAITCPRNRGWTASSGDCVMNAPYSVALPNVPIADLSELSLSGSAASSGDSVFFAVGTYVYGMKNAQKDGITDLSQHWTGAEFNVVGNGGGTRAVFNAGTTITVSLEAATGYSLAPDCQSNAGTTGEENNLSFVPPPLTPQERRYPSILFTQSNVASSGHADCVALAGS